MKEKKPDLADLIASISGSSVRDSEVVVCKDILKIMTMSFKEVLPSSLLLRRNSMSAALRFKLELWTASVVSLKNCSRLCEMFLKAKAMSMISQNAAWST